jgi:hypothetical protein
VVFITAAEERRTAMNTDAQSATLRPYVRSAEPDNSFWYMGQLMSALAEGEDTGGRLTVHEILFPPDSGPPLHIHELESFFHALGRPAEAMALPPAGRPPSPEQIAQMEGALAEYGVTFIHEG